VASVVEAEARAQQAGTKAQAARRSIHLLVRGEAATILAESAPSDTPHPHPRPISQLGDMEATLCYHPPFIRRWM